MPPTFALVKHAQENWDDSTRKRITDYSLCAKGGGMDLSDASWADDDDDDVHMTLADPWLHGL
jgi:hypothetical protein